MGTGGHDAGGGELCDGLASHPGGSSNIPRRFILQKPQLSAGHVTNLLSRIQNLPTDKD